MTWEYLWIMSKILLEKELMIIINKTPKNVSTIINNYPEISLK